MKTFAESKNKKPFNWNAFLKQEKFTKRELVRADKLASDWVTCACGNQCSILSSSQEDGPEDYQLNQLGLCFMEKVSNMLYYFTANEVNEFKEEQKDALKTLNKIEKRSTLVIVQEVEKLKEKLSFVGLKVVKK